MGSVNSCCLLPLPQSSPSTSRYLRLKGAALCSPHCRRISVPTSPVDIFGAKANLSSFLKHAAGQVRTNIKKRVTIGETNVSPRLPSKSESRGYYLAIHPLAGSCLTPVCRETISEKRLKPCFYSYKYTATSLFPREHPPRAFTRRYLRLERSVVAANGWLYSVVLVRKNCAPQVTVPLTQTFTHDVIISASHWPDIVVANGRNQTYIRHAAGFLIFRATILGGNFKVVIQESHDLYEIGRSLFHKTRRFPMVLIVSHDSLYFRQFLFMSFSRVNASVKKTFKTFVETFQILLCLKNCEKVNKSPIIPVMFDYLKIDQSVASHPSCLHSSKSIFSFLWRRQCIYTYNNKRSQNLGCESTNTTSVTHLPPCLSLPPVQGVLFTILSISSMS